MEGMRLDAECVLDVRDESEDGLVDEHAHERPDHQHRGQRAQDLCPGVEKHNKQQQQQHTQRR